MKGIILAGGKGTRLYPITLETPKPLITVRKRPILNYLVDMLRQHKIEDIKIIIRESDLNDFKWWEKRHANELAGLKISFAQEPEPMGTFGFIYHKLQRWVGKEDFFLTNGDELKKIDLTAMKNLHQEHKAGATVALVKTEYPQDFGVAILHPNKIHVSSFLEKPINPPSNLISSGTYILSPDKVFSPGLDSRFLMIEKDILPALAREQKLVGHLSDSPFYPCDNIDRWHKAIEEWKN